MNKFTATACAAVMTVWAAAAFAYEDNDWQMRSTNSIEGKIANRLTLKLEEEFQYGDDIGEHFYHHTDGGLSYSFREWFSMGLNYRQIYEKKKGEWKRENRPHLNASFKWKWSDFSLVNRSRLEYRMRQDAKDVWRYRNKSTLAAPLHLPPLDVQPYLAGEIFVDLHEDILNRYRLYAGVKRQLAESLYADVYYLWQTTKGHGQWTDYNIIGIQLKLKF